MPVDLKTYLEQEFCSYVPGAASPNRLDAAVWACVELGGEGAGYGFLELLKQAAGDVAKLATLFGYQTSASPASGVPERPKEVVKSRFYDPYNYAPPNPDRGGEDHDHPCCRCHHVPVRKIDSMMLECPACSARFTVGVTTEPQSRGAYLAEHDALLSRWGFPNKSYAERGGFGRFGRR